MRTSSPGRCSYCGLKALALSSQRPQNLFSGHLRYTKDDPIFITTLQADLHALKGKLKQGDVDMMVKRLKVFEIQAQSQQSEPGGQRLQVLFCKFRVGARASKEPPL